MKIMGRQRPIKDFVVDIKGRLKEIGGGIGAELDTDSHLNENIASPSDDKYFEPHGHNGEDSLKRKRASQQGGSPSNNNTHNASPLSKMRSSMNVLKQREIELD
jgi:nitrate reductase beta subunit